MADLSPVEQIRAAAAWLRAQDQQLPGGRWDLHEDLILTGITSRSVVLTDAADRDGMDALVLSGEWTGEELATIRLLTVLRGALDPFGEVLGQIADGMDDYGAYERYAGTGLTGPDRQRVVADENGRVRHDWTAALAVARTILGTTR
ncbi:hypothetical protein [Streptosporangium jomthongense]|uniref:Uncharacterized protein n=1 Tax=Streptosporangium jomthongense TaxID=1193683 RepID=A0ABV8EWV6_9ACTN